MEKTIKPDAVHSEYHDPKDEVKQVSCSIPLAFLFVIIALLRSPFFARAELYIRHPAVCGISRGRHV